MKIKLKNKDNPIISAWCFSNAGYDSDLIKRINSGKQVSVKRVPKPAWKYVEEVKKINKSKGEK